MITLCFFHPNPGEPTSLWLWNIFWNKVGGIESSILLELGAAGPACDCGVLDDCVAAVMESEQMLKEKRTILAILIIFMLAPLSCDVRCSD